MHVGCSIPATQLLLLSMNALRLELKMYQVRVRQMLTSRQSLCQSEHAAQIQASYMWAGMWQPLLAASLGARCLAGKARTYNYSMMWADD